MDAKISDCLPNWLLANESTTTSPYGFDAMLCPGLTFWRPNTSHPILLDVSHSLRAAANVFAQDPASGLKPIDACVNSSHNSLSNIHDAAAALAHAAGQSSQGLAEYLPLLMNR